MFHGDARDSLDTFTDKQPAVLNTPDSSNNVIRLCVDGLNSTHSAVTLTTEPSNAVSLVKISAAETSGTGKTPAAKKLARIVHLSTNRFRNII